MQLEDDIDAQGELALRHQMLLAFTLVMVVFTIGLAAVVDHSIRAANLEAVARQNSQDAAFFANLLDADMEMELLAIKTRADNMDTIGLLRDTGRLEQSLNNLKHSKPRYSWLGYADLQGKVLAASEGMLRGADVSARPWFQIGKSRAATVDVHEAVLLNKLLNPNGANPLRFVDVVSPVKDRSGVVVGVLAAHLSVDWLNAQMEFYAQSLLHGGDNKPTVIGADGKVRFGRELEPALLEQLTARQQQNQAESQWFLYEAPGQEAQLVSIARHRGAESAESIQWTSVISLPRSVIDRAAQATRLYALGGIVLAGLAAWATLWWLLRVAARPVRVLMREIKRSRDTHQPLVAHPGLPREFIEVTESINDFLVSIKSREVLLEQALIDMRDSFTGVSESFPGVLFRVEEVGDGSAQFTYLSPSARHYLGLDLDAMPLATAKLFEHVPEDQRDALRQTLRGQANSGQDMDATLPVTGGDGVERMMRVRARAHGRRADRRSWDGVMVDVSDLIEAERMAAAADSAKSTFLAAMSHEIRTPLNGILGFSQLLLQDAQTEQQRADVRKVIDTAETLGRILNDILDFSKIEEGKLHLEARPFDLAETVEAAAALFRQEAFSRHIDFALDLQMAHAQRLLGDPTRLRQILANLLSNALKFTSAGSVRLSVASETPQGGRSQLTIAVHDTGIGMSPEQRQKLFRRFEQADTTIFRRFGGSGLGLAIVKGLVDAMGGNISVASNLNIGTTFTLHFSLPVIQGQAVATDVPTALPQRSYKVLVVDDVPMNRELICRMLLKDGHRVEEAGDGQEAIASAQAQAFDLILMDVDMPVCNGLDAARAIRANEGPSRRAPIIALTGFAYEQDVAKALAAGMNAHLAKPVNFGKLRAQISELFKTEQVDTQES